MNKEEILEKSRAENRNKDIYEKEVLKQASTSAVIVMMVLATIFLMKHYRDITRNRRGQTAALPIITRRYGTQNRKSRSMN